MQQATNNPNFAEMRDFDKPKPVSEVDLSMFNTRNVIDMRGMFDRCRSLTTIDLSSFDTSKVTNMNTMFHSTGRESTQFKVNCTSWNVEKVFSGSDYGFKNGAKYSTK